MAAKDAKWCTRGELVVRLLEREPDEPITLREVMNLVDALDLKRWIGEWQRVYDKYHSEKLKPITQVAPASQG